jgi:tetratricopeptide (TPR) repeat protein
LIIAYNPYFMLKNLSIVVLYLMLSVPVMSQQTASFTNDLAFFHQAIELYNNNQYLAAQQVFATVKKTTTKERVESDCAYYIATCAIRLNQQDADLLMEAFVTNYPTSVKRNTAYLNVANYYFDYGNYSAAKKWYSNVDISSLSPTEAERFAFNNGYTFFKAKQYTKAKHYLNRVADSKKYGAQATYYLGFIAYQGNDYQAANALFNKVKDTKRYNKELSYYQADMNFKLGDFQKAIEMGKIYFNRASSKEKSELSKIIGESYFNLEGYADAIAYLKAYKGKKGRWTNTDYYQLGYAYFKQEDFASAIDAFNSIIDGRDAVAQNAYYHLAASYLKLGKKLEALNAFKNALEMDFSLEIQEDSFLNYAKLSYDIGNSYASVPLVLSDFISKYPNNKNNDQLREVLIDSYITSRNYKEALHLLERTTTFQSKVAYQKVAFLRGLEVYNEGAYKAAKGFFVRSLKEPRDPIFTARAIYWNAESDFQLSDFDAASLGYKQFMQLPDAVNTKEYTNAPYHIGYAYFKQKEYKTAAIHFEHFVATKGIDTTTKNDAFVRLGDSYFVTSQYWQAMENYNAALMDRAIDRDYATFQKAISYGFVDRIDLKIAVLDSFGSAFPKSFYRDDALYELANTYVSQNNTSAAMDAYHQLLQQHPKSRYVSKTLLKKALLLDNGGDSNAALALFKKVANEFSSSPQGLLAVRSAKIIYIEEGRVDEYANWVKTLDFISLEDEELDDATYKAAEKPYLENKVSEPIKRFEEYLEEFSHGVHAIQAHFYLGQLYFGKAEMAATILHYTYVIEKERNEFTEQALARLSEVYLSDKDYKNAVQFLARLETEADFPQNLIFAQTNLMKASYELKQYTTAVVYAEKVLQNIKVDSAIKSDAQVIIARSAIKTGDTGKAEIAYAEVSKIATGQLAAEALYYEAYFKNKRGDFINSNIMVQRLAKEYSAYTLYGAKGLLVMADNFKELGDAYQATYILESVVVNFEDYPALIKEAQDALLIIKTAESKTNSSIETPEGN